MVSSTYDNLIFFEPYAQMSRSRQGLEGADVRHQFKLLFPELTGKHVLDLGCKYADNPRHGGRTAPPHDTAGQSQKEKKRLLQSLICKGRFPMKPFTHAVPGTAEA